jgi:hypothetical protein
MEYADLLALCIVSDLREVRFQCTAILALQEAAEAYLVGLFEESVSQKCIRQLSYAW